MMKMKRYILKHISPIALSILFVLVAIVSCAPLKKYKAEELEYDKLYGRDVQTIDTTVSPLSWKDFFNDAKLQSLIQTALDNNLDLQIAYEHIKQAEASLTGAKMAHVPSLSITPAGGYAVSGASSGMGWNYSATASLSWEADIFGRLANRQKIAEASLAEQQDYRQAVRVGIISSVANYYYLLLMYDEQLRTSLDMEKVWEKSVETIHILKREGFADEVAVSQYEATYFDLRTITSQLKNSIRTTENELSTLLSIPPTTIDRTELAFQSVPDLLNIGVPINMLSYRPDIRAAQRAVEKAYYTTKDAWLNFYPTLSITGSAGLSNAVSGVIVPFYWLSNLTAGLTAPILNRGVNRANLKIAESQQRESKLLLDQTLLKAGQEVNDALSLYKSCDDNIKHYMDQVTSLVKARENTELLMNNTQDKTYLDVLMAHNALIDAKFNSISNLAQRLQAAVSVYSALGGGSEY